MTRLHSSLGRKMYIDNFGYNEEWLYSLESIEYRNERDLATAEYTVLFAEVFVKSNNEPADRNAVLDSSGVAVIPCDKYVINYTELLSLLKDCKEEFINGELILQFLNGVGEVPSNVIQYYNGVSNAPSLAVLAFIASSSDRIGASSNCLVLYPAVGVVMCRYSKLFSELGGEIGEVEALGLPWYRRDKAKNVAERNNRLQSDICYFFAGVESVEEEDRYCIRCFNKDSGDCFNDYILTRDEAHKFIREHWDRFIDAQSVFHGILLGEPLYSEAGKLGNSDIVRVVSITENATLNSLEVRVIRDSYENNNGITRQSLCTIPFQEGSAINSEYISNWHLSNVPYLTTEESERTRSLFYALKDAVLFCGYESGTSKSLYRTCVTYMNQRFSQMLELKSFPPYAGKVTFSGFVSTVSGRFSFRNDVILDFRDSNLLEHTDISGSFIVPYGEKECDCKRGKVTIVYPQIFAGNSNSLSISEASAVTIRNTPRYNKIRINGLGVSQPFIEVSDIHFNPRYYPTHPDEFSKQIAKLVVNSLPMTRVDLGSCVLHADKVKFCSVSLKSKKLECEASELSIELVDASSVYARIKKLTGLNSCNIMCCNKLNELHLDIDELNLYSLWRICRFCEKLETFIVVVHKRVFARGRKCEEFAQGFPIQFLPSLKKFELVFDTGIVIDIGSKDVLEKGKVLINSKEVQLSKLVTSRNKSGGEL